MKEGKRFDSRHAGRGYSLHAEWKRRPTSAVSCDNSALAPLRLRQSGASVMALAGSSYPDDKTFGHARMRLILEDMCADRDASFLPFTSKKYHRLHENERGSDGATKSLNPSRKSSAPCRASNSHMYMHDASFKTKPNIGTCTYGRRWQAPAPRHLR